MTEPVPEHPAPATQPELPPPGTKRPWHAPKFTIQDADEPDDNDQSWEP
jgi:hypothetical protein